MKIIPFTQIKYHQNIQKNEQKPSVQQNNYQTNTILPHSYNAYLVGFEARVDKGLERFSQANEEHMPYTVKAFLETVDDKSTLTPLQAQQKAFEMLNICDNAEDIKGAFSENEKLFENLINPEQSNARRGIIKAHNDYAPMLAEEGKGVLKSKENLTVYLVKKVFLENKTIEEINKDLAEDLEPDFKQAFLFHNEDAKLVHPATLSALGIKTPGKEYLQSLRYTRDGYSDLVGEKISEGQRAFYDSLTEEERTLRAKKTVANGEAWWASLSTRQKLEMLAEKDAELKMLESYNQSKQKAKKTTTKPTDATAKEVKPRTHTKVGSTLFSQDELFKKWATYNLQIFQANLTEAEKNELNVIQTQKMSQRWHDMSALERTEYLSKMKSGQEPIRFAMVDAWNNCTDIIKDLTIHLKKNQIYKPADLLYSTQEFSVLQSQIMTEFWEAHPEHAVKLGDAIKASHQKIKDAMTNGHFEELKREIGRDKNRRIKEIETFKIDFTAKSTATPDYMTEFRKAFTSQQLSYERLEHLPQAYIDDYFKAIEEGFSEEDVKIWTKSLQNKPLNEEEVEVIKKIGRTTPPESIKATRAIETTLANFLYEKTQNPKVYEFDHGALKLAFMQYMRNHSEIAILVNGKEPFNAKFLDNKKVDMKKLSAMYENLRQPLSDDVAQKIINNFFEVADNDAEQELQTYIKRFGKTAELIFSEKSAYSPNIKDKLYKNFMIRMPENLFGKVASLLDLHTNPFEREAQIKRVNFLLNKRFDFIPSQIMGTFNEEVSRSLRREKYDISVVEARIGAKRTNANETKGLLILPKQGFLVQNKLRMLAAEQVLAEALYDATKNPEVFALPFEQLCDNIEVFGLVKKYPTETRVFDVPHLGRQVELTATKKIDLKNIAREYIACINDVTDNWLNSTVKNDGFGKLLDLVDEISGGETNPKILENIVKRINLYNLRLR